MVSIPVASRNLVLEQHIQNKETLFELSQSLSPLVEKARDLAKVAQEIKDHVAKTTGSTNFSLVNNQAHSVQSRQLIKQLNQVRELLISFAFKAENLNRKITFLSVHQEHLYSGGMPMIPVGDKVTWCSGQVKKLENLVSRLGENQGPVVSAAVRNLENAAQFSQQQVNSDLGKLVAALDQRSH
jgi:hypothetical protein